MRFVCSMPSPPHPPWSFSSVLVLPYWLFFFQRPQRIAFSRLFNGPNKVLLVTAPRAFPFSQMPGVRFTVTLKVLTLTLTSTDPCNSQGNSHSSRQSQQLRTYLFPHLSVNIDCALGPYHAQCSLLGRGGENKVKFLSSKCSLSKSPTTNSVPGKDKWKQCFISKSFSSPTFETNVTMGALVPSLGSKAFLDNLIALWIEEQCSTPWPH